LQRDFAPALGHGAAGLDVAGAVAAAGAVGGEDHYFSEVRDVDFVDVDLAGGGAGGAGFVESVDCVEDDGAVEGI